VIRRAIAWRVRLWRDELDPVPVLGGLVLAAVVGAALVLAWHTATR
jgi:hypothetical protein